MNISRNEISVPLFGDRTTYLASRPSDAVFHRQSAAQNFFRRMDFIGFCLKNGYARVVDSDMRLRRRKQKRIDNWREQTKPKNFINDKRRYYRQEYLQSEHWRRLKAKKLSRNSRCECCNSDSNLDVHHKRYKHLYDVNCYDLITLCRCCHDEIHKWLAENKSGQWSNSMKRNGLPTCMKNKPKHRDYEINESNPF
jgi:hypothetical protein